MANRRLPPKYLGGGQYSDVYRVSKNTIVKIMRHPRTVLEHEQRIYSKLDGLKHVPVCKGFSRKGDEERLALSYMGGSFPSDGIKCINDSNRSLWFVYLGHLMLEVLTLVHSRGIIHGDIHPGNFTFLETVPGSVIEVSLIDFGAALVEGETQDPQYGQINDLYASSRRLLSPTHEPTKIDDLVSLAYTLIYFAKGSSLPWESEHDQVLSSPSLPNLTTLAEAKEAKAMDFCADLPSIYRDFLQEVLSLKPGDAPLYDAYQKAFQAYAEEYISEQNQ